MERAKIKFSVDSIPNRIEFTEYVEDSDGFILGDVTSHTLLFSRNGDVLWFDSNSFDGEGYRTSTVAFAREFSCIVAQDRPHPVHQKSWSDLVRAIYNQFTQEAKASARKEWARELHLRPEDQLDNPR